MRIGFVGLSGPLFYDYRTPASTAPSDTSSSPNPVLDSPFGLMLLYDEIWFLCRSLCPENMRELQFVHILDEEDRLPDLASIDVAPKVAAFRDNPAAEERFQRVRDVFVNYDAVVAAVGIDWDASPDNHTHGLQFGGVTASANSVALECILFDLEVVARLNDSSVELVANSFAQRYLEISEAEVRGIDLTQVLVMDRIPNWLSPAGPYHPVLDEAREHRYLKEFRAWISSTASTADAATVAEVKAQTEAALQETKRELLLRYLDESRLFNTAGKTVVAAAAELVVPFVGAVSTMAQGMHDVHAAKAIRWQGFLVALEQASSADGV